MNILNFMQRFPDDASFIAYLKEQREQSGVVCKHCGCTGHHWDANKLSFECRHCHSRQSLRSGTVMEHRKLPIRYWIAAMHLLTSTKKVFSTAEICRQLGHKRYQPVWEMICKLRDVMGKCDEGYRLTGSVELDEGFFTIERPQDGKNEPLKRSCGSQRKAMILVAVESSPYTKAPKKGRPTTVIGHFKMKAFSNLGSETITGVVKEQLDPSVELATDDSTSYGKFNELVESDHTVTSGKEAVRNFLPWVHIAISNSKRILLDVHHYIKIEYLQYYLSYNTDFKSRTYGRTLCR